jgi:hypothetical protein
LVEDESQEDVEDVIDGRIETAREMGRTIPEPSPTPP